MSCWTIAIRLVRRRILHPWGPSYWHAAGPVHFVPPIAPCMVPPEVACAQKPGALSRLLGAAKAAAVVGSTAAGAAGVAFGGYQAGYLLGGGNGRAALPPIVNVGVRQPPAALIAIGSSGRRFDTPIMPLPGDDFEYSLTDFSPLLPHGVAIPEPTPLGLLSVAMLALVGTRRIRWQRRLKLFQPTAYLSSQPQAEPGIGPPARRAG